MGRGLRRLGFWCLALLSTAQLAAQKDPASECQSPGSCGTEELAVNKPFIDIILPREGEVVRSSEHGIPVLLQVFGLMMAENEAVRMSFNGQESFTDTQELGGRAALPPGNHSLRVELVMDGMPFGGKGTSKEVRFSVHEEQKPEEELWAREPTGQQSSGCHYAILADINKYESSFTEGQVVVSLLVKEENEIFKTEVPLNEQGEGLEEGSQKCKTFQAPCTISPVDHLLLQHRPLDEFEGAFIDWISLRGPSSHPLTCPDSTERNASAPRAGVAEGADGSEGLEGVEEPEQRFFCGQWLDYEAGNSAFCHPASENETVPDAAALPFLEGKRWVTNSKIGISGMMGNQLFQVAALLAHEGIQPQTQVIIPDIPFNGREQERLRIFELLDLSIAMVPSAYLQDRVQERYIERQYHFDPAVRQLPELANLDFLGRFQSYSYFAEAEDYVRSRMPIRKELRRRGESVVGQVKAEFEALHGKNVRVVSLHVRRGDNVPSQRPGIYQGWREEAPELYGEVGDNLAPHLVMTPSYIEKASHRIAREGWCGGVDCVFLVFTDTPADVEWCRSNLHGLQLRFFSDFIPLVATWEKGAGVKGASKRVAPLTDVLDLAGIAACDGHIVSTSTFSWWGAWLNDKPNKRVIVPSPWFNPAHPMGQQSITDGMHPPDWEMMNLLEDQ